MRYDRRVLISLEIVSILNALLHQKARLRKGGMQATFHCPFCPDKNTATQKLEVAIGGTDMGYYHCWRCDSKGRTFGSLLRRLKASQHYRDAIFNLTGDIRVTRSRVYKEDPTFVALPDEFLPISTPRKTPEYRNALSYLKKRKIIPSDIVRYNIGYCEEGKYAHHVIIPSYDAKGILNFFIGRRYYVNDASIPHKKPDVSMNIVGFESFVNYNEDINLCEGVFDAIAIRNNAVPLFGKYPSKKLREAMIINGTKRVNMILDKDALHDAVKNCLMMRRLGIAVHFVHLDGKDPSVLGFDRIHDLIRHAEEFDDDALLRYKAL